jgi:hypothetical protein
VLFAIRDKAVVPVFAIVILFTFLNTNGALIAALTALAGVIYIFVASCLKTYLLDLTRFLPERN